MLQDLQYAIRRLLKDPSITFMIVLTLALGIGANTAIFSVVNGVLLRPLPFKEPNQLVGLRETLPDEGSIPLAYRTFAEWRDRNTVFESIAAMSGWNPNLESGDEPVRVSGMAVTASYFDVMGLHAILGRTFLPEEDRPGVEKTVVLSYELWQNHFGGNRNIIGQPIKINGKSLDVVGVMPPTLINPEIGCTSIWTPLGLDDQKSRSNPGRYLKANARLKPGISIEQSRTELERIISLLKQDFPETHGRNYGAEIRPLEDFVVPKNTRLALLILLSVVGCVLLIACTNVANLLLARTAAREKEIAIRMALGATRGRIIRQLLTESIMLSLLGAIAGLLLAKIGLKLLLSLQPEAIPRLEDIHLDAVVLGFTLLLTVLAGLMFGLAPAIAATKLDLHPMLKEGGRGTGQGYRHNRLRSLLIISEIAIALILLIASSLMIKSYLRLSNVKLGFNPDKVLTMEINLPAVLYPDRSHRVNFFRQTLENISSLPGVTAVSAAESLPLRGPIYTDPVLVEGQPIPPRGQEPSIRQNIVTPYFFRAMGIPLIKGRPFTEQETWGTGGSIIINEAFEHHFFYNEDPLGKRIKLGEDKPWLNVTGVVADTVQSSLVSQPIPEMFYPYINPSDELPLSFMTLVISTTSEPMALVNSVRSEMHRVDPNIPVSKVMTMRMITDKAISAPRFNLLLLVLFASVALLLAAVGIYGVLSYLVAQRKHEIGVRMALGAQSGDVLRLIIKQGMVLTLIGVCIGLVSAFLLTRVLSSLLYGISSTDPLAFTSVSLLLIGVALTACYIPARRATRVDPIVALREE